MKQINNLDNIFRIECNGKTFIIAKDLLRKHSGYFNMLFENYPLQTEYVDDVDPSILNIFMMCSVKLDTLDAKYSESEYIQIYSMR